MNKRHQSLTITTSARKTSRPTIGVLKSNYTGNFNTYQWYGLVDAARKLDVNLICYYGGLLNRWHAPDREFSSAIYDLAGSERLDGLIICTGGINWNSQPAQVEQFVKSYIPLPVVSVEVPIQGIPSLVWNDFEGMSNVVTHLIETHGCKHIGYINGNEYHDCMAQRYQGYLQTLAKNKIASDPAIIWAATLFYNGQKPLDQLAEQIAVTRPDAIAACNDEIAKRLINLIELKGLPAIPIVGFDDNIEGRSGKLALTTVRAPFYKIAYRAVEIMLEMLEGKPVKPLETLPCTMVIRRSCGCDSHAVADKERRYSQLFNALNDDAVSNPAEFIKQTAELVKFREEISPDWSLKLRDAFLTEVQGGKQPIFIPYLEKLFGQTLKDGTEADNWQDIITTLHLTTRSLLIRNGYDLAKAETLLLTAMTLITKLAMHSETYSHTQQLSSIFNTIQYNNRLSEAFDLDSALEQLRVNLAQLRIPSCYVSLYENPGQITDQARLVLAFDVKENKVIKPEDAVFPTRQLVPAAMLAPEQATNYVAKTLFFRSQQIGFALFEVGQHDLSIFEMLSNAISISLYTGMLVGKLENQAAELSKTNTDLEEAYQSLQKNQQKLLISEKMASLGRLTAGIAHEMNTPLAAVRAALKELGDLVDEYEKSIDNQAVLPEDHHAIAADMTKHLKMAGQAAEKSAAFIRGIKAQTNDTNFNNSQLFNAAFVISDALNVLEYAIKKGHCGLVTTLDKSIQLYGDPKRLVQIITNLVMNSVDACQPDGGTLTIKLTGDGSKFAELTVTDTGCGIPPEIIAKIFDPMFTTKPFGVGTGLGLSIVHDLVGEYQGSIKVNSQKGLTAFTIMLPLQKEEAVNG